MKVCEYKNYEVSITYRNPITFINQWEGWKLSHRVRGLFIWCLWIWKRNACDVWVTYGIRIFGIELTLRKWL